MTPALRPGELVRLKGGHVEWRVVSERNGMVHLERDGASSFDLIEDIERVPPTSRELMALTRCSFHAYTEHAVYHFEAKEVRLTLRGVHLPEPYHSMAIESLWCELENGTLVYLRGDLRGSYCEAGRVACASA
jgi:hypothetical protein